MGLRIRIGEAHVIVRARISDTGLQAIGDPVSNILLSTAVLVLVATFPARRHPIATNLLTRR